MKVKDKRQHRKIRIRKKVSGTSTTPRIAVFKSNSNIYAQKKGEGALAAAGVLAGIGAAALAVEQMKEELELFATNYVLETYNLEAFKLKVNGLGSKSKACDVSSVATYAFNVTPLELEYKNPMPFGP